MTRQPQIAAKILTQTTFPTMESDKDGARRSHVETALAAAQAAAVNGPRATGAVLSARMGETILSDAYVSLSPDVEYFIRRTTIDADGNEDVLRAMEGLAEEAAEQIEGSQLGEAYSNWLADQGYHTSTPAEQEVMKADALLVIAATFAHHAAAAALTATVRAARTAPVDGSAMGALAQRVSDIIADTLSDRDDIVVDVPDTVPVAWWEDKEDQG